jgi:hypothetical protein
MDTNYHSSNFPPSPSLLLPPNSLVTHQYIAGSNGSRIRLRIEPEDGPSDSRVIRDPCLLKDGKDQLHSSAGPGMKTIYRTDENSIVVSVNVTQDPPFSAGENRSASQDRPLEDDIHERTSHKNLAATGTAGHLGGKIADGVKRLFHSSRAPSLSGRSERGRYRRSPAQTAAGSPALSDSVQQPELKLEERDGDGPAYRGWESTRGDDPEWNPQFHVTRASEESGYSV